MERKIKVEFTEDQVRSLFDAIEARYTFMDFLVQTGQMPQKTEYARDQLGTLNEIREILEEGVAL